MRRRIRSLESHVAEIRQTQTTISNTLSELVHYLRNGGVPARSPSAYPSSSFQPSPSLNSPSVSTPTVSHPHASPPSATSSFTSGSNLSQPRPQRSATYPNPSVAPSGQPQEDAHPSQLPPMYGNFTPGGPNYNTPTPGPVLPPFSSIQTMGPPVSQQGNISSVRYQSSEPGYRGSSSKYPSGSKRQAPSSSNVTSADSSDLEDDDGGELPASGLLAPWEVLRGLADVAIERAAKVCC